MYDPKETNNAAVWPAWAFASGVATNDPAEAVNSAISATAAAAWASVHADERRSAAGETRRRLSGVFERVAAWFARRRAAKAERGFGLAPAASVRHAARAEALRSWVALF